MRKSPIVAAMVLLSACAGSPESHYFTLSATPPRQEPGPDRPSYHLTTLTLPELYDRPQFVTRTGPQAIDIDEYDRWAEPLQRMTARILAQDLAMRRPQSLGPLPAAADQPRLRLSIDEFDADRSTGQVRLSGNWALSGTDGTPDRGGPFSYREPVSGNDPAAIAAAMSDLLGQLADDIARD